MKKSIISLFSICSLFTVASCNMLDEINYGNPTVEDMMGNPENVVMTVGQIYADLKYTHDHWGYWGLQTITADEGIAVPRNSGKDWNDGGYWLKQNTHTWDYRGDALKNVWNITVSGAVLCNKIMYNLDLFKENMSEEVYNQYVAETEVMRCYYYYLMFDCFGRIPYTESFDNSVTPLLEPEDVWSRLVATLEKDAPKMAVVKNDADRAAYYGRTTQGFAYALLARLYLNAEGFGCTMDNIFKNIEKPVQFNGSFYDNCVRCCDAVIDSKGYSIESDYFANFKIFNESSKENIFVIVENGLVDDERDSGGSQPCKNKNRVLMNTHHYGIQSYYDMILDTWNGFSARPEFLNIFKSKTAPVLTKDDWFDASKFVGYYNSDVRGPGIEIQGTANKKPWGWFLGPVHKQGSTTELFVDNKMKDNEHPSGLPTIIRPGITNIMNAHNFDGARLNKWEIDKTKTYKYMENDFPIMRYADVLLMKLEAVKRGGNGTDVTTEKDFRMLMERAFANDDATPDKVQKFIDTYGDPASWTLDDILAERGRELSWEMVRRRDLIRYNKFNDIQYVTDAKAKEPVRKWFPIPYSVLQKSLLDEQGNPVWTQTPGY